MKGINSVPVMVIALLMRAGRHRLTPAAAVEEILRHAPRLMYRWGLQSPERMERYIGNRLEELSELGMVSGSKEGGYELRWQDVDGSKRPPHGDDVDGTDPPIPPGNSTGGPQSDGRGIGARELLLHPVLFTLGDEDFDALLEGMLGSDHGR